MEIEITLEETKTVNCRIKLEKVTLDLQKNRKRARVNFELVDVATGEAIKIDGLDSILIDGAKFRNKILPACKDEGNLFFEIRKQIKQVVEDRGGTVTDIDDDVYIPEPVE